MSYELIISTVGNENRIALLKDNSLVEYQVESGENKFQVGDIYLGTIRKVSTGMNACFVDVGHEKDGFLHYHDLGPQVNTLNKILKDLLSKKSTYDGSLSNIELNNDIDKDGKISEVFSRNKKVLVQIVKEPISTKGPRLTCEISMAGRYVILVPFGKGVSISKSIADTEEKKRLSTLITSIRPKNFGIIVRTAAEGKDVEELNNDLQTLVNKWKGGIKSLKKARTRDKIIGESNRIKTFIRDMLSGSFDSVIVDDQVLFEQINDYIATIAPEKSKIVKKYNGKIKLFEAFGIEKQLKLLFGRNVSIHGGGYLIIEHTEAMHVIDVNSGNKSNMQEGQEQTALTVNLSAVSEISRQLKLRDLGGIVVVDFIDMKDNENKKVLLAKMKEDLKEDRSRTTVLPLSRFGLMQITRQRVRPETSMTTTEICDTCNGTGKITASIAVSEIIEQKISTLTEDNKIKSFKIVLHPYLHSYFTKGIFSIQMGWYKKYRTWIKLEKDSSKALSQFTFVSKEGKVLFDEDKSKKKIVK